jgi:hypothetical protein
VSQDHELESGASPEIHPVDRLVRTHLNREAERLDASSLLARIRCDLEVGRRSTRSAPLSKAGVSRQDCRRAFGWPLLVAMGLVIAFLGGRYLNTAIASPTALLQGVRAAHLQNVDRCYFVQFAPDPRYTDPALPLDRPTDNTLWTRGDRFWCDCQIGDRRIAVGRDGHGQLWCAPSRRKGILLPGNAAEVSPEIQLLCDINSMRIPTLIEEVLADFELHADPPTSSSAGATSLVSARLKPGRKHSLLSAAVMEIDARSDVLVRLVLWVVRDGRPHGTVTFTWVESAVKGDAQYGLAAHVDEDAEIEVQSAQNE